LGKVTNIWYPNSTPGIHTATASQTAHGGGLELFLFDRGVGVLSVSLESAQQPPLALASVKKFQYRLCQFLSEKAALLE